MAVTLEDLADHLGMSYPVEDPASLQRALDTATAVIEPYLIVPMADRNQGQNAAYDQSVLTVAGDVWRRKDAPGGVYGFADGGDYPTALPRDPLTPVRPILQESRLIAKGSIG